MLMLQMLLGSFIGADAIGVMTATGAMMGLMQMLQMHGYYDGALPML